MWKQFHTRYMQKAIISRCAGRRARPREKCRDTYSLRLRDVIDFNTVFHRSSQTISKIPLVFTSKTKRKTSGTLNPEQDQKKQWIRTSHFSVEKYTISRSNKCKCHKGHIISNSLVLLNTTKGINSGIRTDWSGETRLRFHQISLLDAKNY